MIGFIEAAIADRLGMEPELFCVAARAVLTARGRGDEPGVDPVEWDRFAAAFEHFIDAELVDAQLAAARAELGRVAEELRDAVLLRRAALDLDVTTLADRVDRFRSAACAQQQVFEEDRLLLAHDVDSLTAQIGESLRLFAQSEPARWYARIEELAAELPIRLLDDGLRGVVEHAVRASFDAFRAAESTRAEHAWCDLADRFRTRTQERVDSIRGDAADLFAVDFPTLAVPTVSGKQERFFYLFLHVGSSTEGLGRLASRILPAGLVRRRMLANARRQLIREFDKHAGRGALGSGTASQQRAEDI